MSVQTIQEAAIRMGLDAQGVYAYEGHGGRGRGGWEGPQTALREGEGEEDWVGSASDHTLDGESLARLKRAPGHSCPLEESPGRKIYPGCNTSAMPSTWLRKFRGSVAVG